MIFKTKIGAQNKILLSFICIFFISILCICILMYQKFTKNLDETLQTRALEVFDIIDYMVHTSGESPDLIKGIKTLAANRDIKLIIIRINNPPVVIASNKDELIGLPGNDIFHKSESDQSYNFDSKNDQYTAISTIWMENIFKDDQFTEASVGVVFNTHKTRTLLINSILNTSLFLILTMIFAIGIIYILTNKFIFRPLNAINSTLIKNVSENEFIPIPIESHDEIGTVANTLNNLFTELYASKKSLRETTERYELALQNTEVGLFDWDIKHDTIYCSSSFREILGIYSDQFTPTLEWFDNLVHKDDKSLATSALIAHLKHNVNYDIEGRIRHKNGDYIWVRARGQALRDESGKAIRMVGYYVDIGKRKRYEMFMHSFYMLLSDLNLSLERKLNCLLKETCNYLNLDCGIISKIENEKYYTIYCHAPIEYNLNKNKTLNLSDTLCEYVIEKDEILCIPDIVNSDFSHHKSYTQYRIKSYIAFPIYMNGHVFGTVNLFDKNARTTNFEEREKSFVRLISQFISNEMMRAQYIDFLHESENKLEAAIEELTNTNSELENFTYVASHDLQEPLRMITNFTGILNNKYNDTLDETAKEYLNICSNSAEQMRLLINDLLDYAHASNIDNEKIENVNLNKILEHVIVNIEKQIHETNTEIMYDNLPTIVSNKASMISLMQNLISNGIKFQNYGNRPIISITSNINDSSWIISVHDNGIGVPYQYQSKIFEPFKRLHAKSEYQGTGIGLAVCKKIIERINGNIWLESKEGCGSTFTFSIPIVMSQTGKAA